MFALVNFCVQGGLLGDFMGQLVFAMLLLHMYIECVRIISMVSINISSKDVQLVSSIVFHLIYFEIDSAGLMWCENDNGAATLLHKGNSCGYNGIES